MAIGSKLSELGAGASWERAGRLERAGSELEQGEQAGRLERAGSELGGWRELEASWEQAGASWSELGGLRELGVSWSKGSKLE